MEEMWILRRSSRSRGSSISVRSVEAPTLIGEPARFGIVSRDLYQKRSRLRFWSAARRAVACFRLVDLEIPCSF
jgi:hypothetical protein